MGEAFITRRGGSGCKDAYLTQFDVSVGRETWEQTVTLPLDVKAFRVSAFSMTSTALDTMVERVTKMTPLITEPGEYAVSYWTYLNATITVEKTATEWEITAKVTGQGDNIMAKDYLFVLCVE